MTVSFKINLNDYNIKVKKANLLEIKKIIVALAGPVANILIALFFYKFNIFASIKNEIIYANLLISIFNLLPIYPLDGGRILKGFLHIYFGKWSAKKYIIKISIIMCTIINAIASIAILYINNISIFLIVLYLWTIVIKEKARYNKKLKFYKLVKTIENN